MKTRSPLIGTKSVIEKMEDMKQEILSSVESNPEPEQEVISAKREIQGTNELQKVMREHRLVKKQKRISANCDQDLHADFQISCIREGKTMEEVMVDLISEHVRKNKKRFER